MPPPCWGGWFVRRAMLHFLASRLSVASCPPARLSGACTGEWCSSGRHWGHASYAVPSLADSISAGPWCLPGRPERVLCGQCGPHSAMETMCTSTPCAQYLFVCLLVIPSYCVRFEQPMQKVSIPHFQSVGKIFLLRYPFGLWLCCVGDCKMPHSRTVAFQHPPRHACPCVWRHSPPHALHWFRAPLPVDIARRTYGISSSLGTR